MKPLMVQGTCSDAGKTTLVTGLCRMFANQGLKVAPFKSQNMSLNSFVTRRNEEIARATATQAFAAREEPCVHMNPLLLKPKSDEVAQLIVHGRAAMDVSAADYFLSDKLQGMKLDAIRKSLSYLKQNYDLIVAEGGGSCAEPNLRTLDVVNMGAAHELGAQVIIVSDLDRGGAFADLVGTIEIIRRTCPADLDLVAGFVLNKFRGDARVLAPAIDFLEHHTGFPVLGVIPLVNGLRLEEEDRVREHRCEHPETDVAVIYLPHISNANDFDFLAAERNVQVRFVKSRESIGLPDAIIIPGSRNVTWDLDYLRRNGIADAIVNMSASTPVAGICGGFEMMGRMLLDPQRVESELGSMAGLGLLDVDVKFVPDKTLANREYWPERENPFLRAGAIRGYEIHCGTVSRRGCAPLFRHEGGWDGAIHPERLIFGTFIHDLFSNREFTRGFVNLLRERRGLEPLSGDAPHLRDDADADCEMLARLLEERIPARLLQ